MLPPSGSPRAGDAVHRAAAALGADQARAPFRHRQIGTVTLGLLAGIDIDPVPAGVAPGAQQQIRPSRAAKRAWVAPHAGDDAPVEGASAEPVDAPCCWDGLRRRSAQQPSYGRRIALVSVNPRRCLAAAAKGCGNCYCGARAPLLGAFDFPRDGHRGRRIARLPQVVLTVARRA